MRTTGNLSLKKPEGTDVVDIADLNGNMDILDAEVVKKAATTADGRMSKEDKAKLDGIAVGANNYVHPATHSPSIIAQDAANRFVSDTEKAAWNAKETTAGAQAKADAVMSTHMADYVRQPGYAVATGSANAYAVSLNPVPTAYTEGMAVVVKINTDNTGASSINVNGLGAKAIKKGNGNDVAAGNLKTGSIYTFRYNGTNFILQGEGGDVGKPPNLVKNGNFQNGVNCWNSLNANISTASNILVRTATAQWGRAIQSVPMPAVNDIIYFCCSYYGATSNRIYFEQASAQGLAVTNVPVAGSWQFVSGWAIMPSGATVSNLVFDDSAASGWAAAQIKQVMFINLTQVFGTGKEPDKATMDALVQELGGWWDSTLSLLTSDAWLDPAMVVQGFSGYDDGIKKDGTMPNRTFAANGGNYTEAVEMRADGGGAIYVRPQTGYYLNEINGGGFGPISKWNSGLTPAVIKKGAQVLNLVGAYDYAADFDIPGFSEQMLWERISCVSRDLYTRLSDGNIVYIGYDGNNPTTYYNAVKINGATGQTIWAVPITGISSLMSGSAIIKTDIYDNVYIVINNVSKMAKIASNGALSWVINSSNFFCGLEFTGDNSTVLSLGERNLYKINPTTGGITTILMTGIHPDYKATSGDGLRLMPDGTLTATFWDSVADTYRLFRFDINGNILSMGNYTNDTVRYKKCGSYYVYIKSGVGIFRTPNVDFSGEVQIAPLDGMTDVVMSLPNNRVLLMSGSYLPSSYKIIDINGTLLKYSGVNRPDSNSYLPLSWRCIYPNGDFVWHNLYSNTLRRYKRGTYL